MLDTKMEAGVAKEVVRGAPDALWSEFRLGYAPLLAQMRSEDADPEALLGASFRQFQLQRALPPLQAALSAKVPPARPRPLHPPGSPPTPATRRLREKWRVVVRGG